MQLGDRDAVARLIFTSTNQYYESIGRPPVFQGDALSPGFIFDVYERLDPGHGLLAIQGETIVGSCFVHPRPTHYGLGIMNVHPEHFGKGIARKILAEIIRRAESDTKSIRLVSSCLNLDSYSLYTRVGFVPFRTFQDMYLVVPETGIAVSGDADVQEGTLADLSDIIALERELNGIEREMDFRYFLEAPNDQWNLSIFRNGNGGLEGFLVSCGDKSNPMLGPGCCRTEEVGVSLLAAELNRYRGRLFVFLVPVDCSKIVQTAYSWGARNCEMHVAQELSNGAERTATHVGVVFPTFLPESG